MDEPPIHHNYLLDGLKCKSKIVCPKFWVDFPEQCSACKCLKKEYNLFWNWSTKKWHNPGGTNIWNRYRDRASVFTGGIWWEKNRKSMGSFGERLHFLMGALGKNVLFGSFGDSCFSPIEIPNIEFLTLERMIVHRITWNNQFGVEIEKLLAFGDRSKEKIGGLWARAIDLKKDRMIGWQWRWKWRS